MSKIKSKQKVSWKWEALTWTVAAFMAFLTTQADSLGPRLCALTVALIASADGAVQFARRRQTPMKASRKYMLILVVCLAFAFSGVFLAIVSAGEHWNGKITMLGFTVCLIAVGKAVSLPEFPAWERAYNQRMLERATLAEIKARRTNNTRK